MPSGSSIDAVKDILRNILPDEEVRRKCLDFLVESIGVASLSASDRWGLTVKKDLVRLNAGKIEVLAFLRKGDLYIMHCLIDLDTIPDAVSDFEDGGIVLISYGKGDPRLGFYNSVPGSVICDFFASDFDKVAPVIQNTHHTLVEKASRTPRNPRTKKGHCPEAIELLASITGRDISQPTY